MIIKPQDKYTTLIELPPRGRTISFYNDANANPEKYYINFPQLNFKISHWQAADGMVRYSGLKALKTKNSYPFFPNMSLKDKGFCLGASYSADNENDLCDKVMNAFWNTSFYWSPVLSHQFYMNDLFVEAAKDHKLLNFDIRDGIIHIYDDDFRVKRLYRIPT